MKKHTYITDIQGAVVYPEIEEFEKDGELYFKIPEVNKAYKYAIARTHHWGLLVSKDLSSWVLAIAVMADGTEEDANTFRQMMINGGKEGIITELREVKA